MFKAFSYLLAFAVICLIGLFAWLVFIDVPIVQQTIEQPVTLPSQS
jgi:hypothetical protein